MKRKTILWLLGILILIVCALTVLIYNNNTDMGNAKGVRDGQFSGNAIMGDLIKRLSQRPEDTSNAPDDTKDTEKPETPDEPKQPDKTPDEEAEKWITPEESVDLRSMHLYWQHENIGINAGNDAILSLYVAAGQNEEGAFIFDDGQDWLLVMETAQGFYRFLDQYVQLGKVTSDYFYDADNTLRVVVSVVTMHNYEIYDYIYDQDRQEFKQLRVYKS